MVKITEGRPYVENLMKIRSYCYASGSPVEGLEISCYAEDDIDKLTYLKMVSVFAKMYPQFNLSDITDKDEIKSKLDFRVEDFKKSDRPYNKGQLFRYIILMMIKAACGKSSEKIEIAYDDKTTEWDMESRNYVNKGVFLYSDCTDESIIDEVKAMIQQENLPFSISTKIKKFKYSAGKYGEGNEFLEEDYLGNKPEPGDLVITNEGQMDVFVGYNKASWKLLNGYGYGYVVRKHHCNSQNVNDVNFPDEVV